MADFILTDEYGFLGGVGGSCVFCNASKRTTDRPERIVTTSMVTDAPEFPPGVWPEKYLEMCETCITELGHLVGMVSEKEYQTLAQELEAAELALASQAEELEMYKREVGLIAQLREMVESKMPSSIPADPPVTRTKR